MNDEIEYIDHGTHLEVTDAERRFRLGKILCVQYHRRARWYPHLDVAGFSFTSLELRELADHVEGFVPREGR